MTTTYATPTNEQRQTLRDHGWGFHIRYLRGTAEILGRNGEAYLFPLTVDGMQQLQGFIDECVLASEGGVQ